MMVLNILVLLLMLLIVKCQSRTSSNRAGRILPLNFNNNQNQPLQPNISLAPSKFRPPGRKKMHSNDAHISNTVWIEDKDKANIGTEKCIMKLNWVSSTYSCTSHTVSSIMTCEVSFPKWFPVEGKHTYTCDMMTGIWIPGPVVLREPRIKKSKNIKRSSLNMFDFMDGEHMFPVLSPQKETVVSPGNVAATTSTNTVTTPTTPTTNTSTTIKPTAEKLLTTTDVEEERPRIYIEILGFEFDDKLH